LYSDKNITQRNVYGLDNVGYIDASGGKYFYLKDHLGSVRVVIDTNTTVVSAYDYDPWGYPFQDRTYEAGSTGQRYKFTAKERDLESAGDGVTGYDYFGARYYDSRIGRWGQVEPKIDKYVSWSPYNYAACNPLLLTDCNGKDLFIGGDKTKALEDLKSLFSDESIQNRIEVDNAGKVNFNTSGLDVNSDAALELLSNLTAPGQYKYLYEVANQTTGINRENGEPILYTEGDIDQIGMENFSITPRNIDNASGTPGPLPKDGYSGQVTLGTGEWTIPGVPGSEVLQDRWNMVFHELAENYYRTEKKQPYMRFDKKQSGAHQSAIEYAKNFKRNTSSSPGEAGKYEP